MEVSDEIIQMRNFAEKMYFSEDREQTFALIERHSEAFEFIPEETMVTDFLNIEKWN
jgi:hypothetical protein